MKHYPKCNIEKKSIQNDASFNEKNYVICNDDAFPLVNSITETVFLAYVDCLFLPEALTVEAFVVINVAPVYMKYSDDESYIRS